MYVVLVKEYINNKLVESWYIKNNTYPGTQLYKSKNLAIETAKFWTFTYENNPLHRLEADIIKYEEGKIYA